MVRIAIEVAAAHGIKLEVNKRERGERLCG
jgi:hypothetical protein